MEEVHQGIETIVATHALISWAWGRPTSKDVFTMMELILYLRYEEAKSKRYLNWKSIYRSGNVEGFGFLLKPKAIIDTSDSSPVNNREFWVRYQMNGSSFWNLHKKIKDHKVFHHTGTGRQETSQIRISAVIFDFLAFLGIEGCGLSNRKAYHQFISKRSRQFQTLQRTLCHSHIRFTKRSMFLAWSWQAESDSNFVLWWLQSS